MAQEIEQQNGGASFAALKPQLMLPAGKADEAVQFYKTAFGAEELKRISHPKRKADQELPLILCAELKIGSASLLVCDQSDDSSCAAGNDSGSGIVFRLETKDVEGALERAVKAGAAKEGEIVEEDGVCCGGVVGKVKDPFGVAWIIASASKAADVEA
ncbi:Glyoxalase/Bleomycin resistance protein/Dihydroxybiphenyl dioxygenase protein [Dioscorea alata]|uniref:Glyoxalase/Bleomycin resistance protein/Dihydroxybiphenyl dioxygenase protein n=1 Tax=Dioscorea alata TaxID=55571 RepID=A0ACB7W6A6_DIOAL|nr:Glyoxalase/Bleomycin resistance protein/Dihydroxybiphenyl dioxygenase protein [Dioscorea alata]